MTFLSSFLEFMMYLALFCGFYLHTAKDRKLYLIGAAVSAFQAVISLFPLPHLLLLILAIVADFAGLYLIFRKPLLHMCLLFFFSYILLFLLEAIQLPFWMLLHVDMLNGYVPILGSFIALGLALLCGRFLPLYRLQETLAAKNTTLALIFTDSFLTIAGIVLLFQSSQTDFFSHYVIILTLLLILVCINGEVLVNHEKDVRRRQELEAYQNYLPVVEGLIDQIRSRQHNYHNIIQNIRALGYTCSDPQELAGELLQVTDHYMSEDIPMELLKLSMHLTAGFLISKEKEAASKGMDLRIKIQNYHLVSACTEYEIIDCIGILIDNALEASASGDILYAQIGSDDTQLSFEIRNPGPLLTADFCRDIFRKGYSTKKEHRLEHGYGLYALNLFLKERHGELVLQNMTIEGKRYVSFRMML